MISKKKQPGVPEQHATRAIFFVGGFGAASWAPLVPLLKARLGIAEDVLGMLLIYCDRAGVDLEQAMRRKWLSWLEKS